MYSEGAAPSSRLRIAVRLRVAFRIISAFFGSCKLVEVLWESGGFRLVSTILVKTEDSFGDWPTTIEDTQRWMPLVGVSLSSLKYCSWLQAVFLRFCNLVEALRVVEGLRSVSFLNVERQGDVGECPTPSRDILRTFTSYLGFFKLV